MKNGSYAEIQGSPRFAKLLHFMQLLFLVLSLALAYDFVWGFGYWVPRDFTNRLPSLFLALVLPICAVSFARGILAGVDETSSFQPSIIMMEGRWPLLSWKLPDMRE